MEKNGKVSICIPTYNNVQDVKQVLESIFEQTYANFEVNITDDSTNMEIEDLLHTYTDNRIRYVHNEKKLGHIYNWNAAIRMATGDYIKIMFSDDWFTYTDSLARYVQLLEENPKADFAFASSMQVSDTASKERYITEEFITSLTTDYTRVFRGNQIGAPSGTIYRNNGILFDEKSNWASDLELYLQLLKHNPVFAYTRDPLISIGLHGEQYTHMFSEKDDRIFNDYLFMYEKFHLEKNEACKHFFLEEYILKFDKGGAMAKRCGNTIGEYWKARISYLWQNKVMDYWHAFLRKMHKNDTRK